MSEKFGEKLARSVKNLSAVKRVRPAQQAVRNGPIDVIGLAVATSSLRAAYMSAPHAHEVTNLLRAWTAGDEKALEKLTSLVYAELRRRAHRYMSREAPGHILQTTALINEVYVRVVDLQEMTWQDRAHFLAVCAKLMRQILTDLARARLYQKRGPGAVHVSLEQASLPSDAPRVDLLVLDEALDALARIDARKGRVVELRFFGGLTVEETAEVLKVSPETVMRDWKFAKACLHEELSKSNRHGP
jgi:RNA polymerase sigma factor (TIGR02999 family)